MNTVTALSDHLKEYTIGLRQCKTRTRLREFLEHWMPFAPDAFKACPQNEQEFKQFERGLKKESKGHYAGDAYALRFGDILMPTLLLRVAVIASEYHAPWGVAFIQLTRAGRITQSEDGIYQWIENPDR